MVSYSTFIAAGFLFGLVTAILGFVAGMYCTWMIPGADRATESKPTDPTVEAELQRARTASSTLAVIADNMSSDVSAHSTKIEEISADLQFTDTLPSPSNLVCDSVSQRILEANRQLQVQLAEAKAHIEVQAAQLRFRDLEARTDL